MITEVSEYLRLVATPEYCAVADKVMGVFDTFEYDEHEQELLNLSLQSGVAEESSVLQDIHFTLDEHCRALLAMHHIKMVDTASLDLMSEVLNGLFMMQNWEDKQTLARLLEQDAEPEEIFSDVIREVVGLESITVQDALEEFDEAVNKRLSQLLTGSLPEAEQEEEDISHEQLTRLKNYHQFAGSDKLIGFRLVKLGYRVGAPFDNYYRKVKRHFEAMEPTQFAHEIIALLLLGRDTWTSPSQSFTDLASTVLELELDASSKIDILIREQWTQFLRMSQS